MSEASAETKTNYASPGERAFAYRVLRYTPNLVRDEWVNIGRHSDFCSRNRRTPSALD
jgi:hypothetical protein